MRKILIVICMIIMAGGGLFTSCTKQWTIKVEANDDAFGTVYGSGTYADGTIAIISAKPNEGCWFVNWDDGSPDNPRSIMVTSNTSYTAIFEKYFQITVKANPEVGGVVCGSGSYLDQASVTIVATPNAGYHFIRWQDGVTDNPRTILVTGDATYTAYFANN